MKKRADLLFQLSELYWEKSRYLYRKEMLAFFNAQKENDEKKNRGEKVAEAKEDHRESELYRSETMRLYDTIYEERYMGLPSDNAEGYRQGSPLTFADRLQGKLLLIHGTGDDNCHYQGAEALVNAFIAHGKQFRMMS